MEKGQIFEEIYQRVEDDAERKAKLLEVLNSSTEQINRESDMKGCNWNMQLKFQTHARDGS